MDKRVLKTKRNIKQTLIEMIKTKSFEDISVVDICEKAMTSRITFYSYYENKQALMDEILIDYIQQATDIYHRLQVENNPYNDAYKEYENLLDCIMEVFFSDIDFFKNLNPKYNPALFSTFFIHTFTTVDNFMNKHHCLKPVYPSRQTAALVCSGIFSVLAFSNDEGMDPVANKELTHKMYKDILLSNIFVHN